ncbi:MAG: sugar phosphate isomerase/epimerase [Trueperaceae bacterium]|nr:MAG: sugar phosphate isomerase/epimerase [Trueperaceae bacterium]
MKIGVFTAMLPDLTPEEAVWELKEVGYDGVEWRVTHTPQELKRQEPSFWGHNLCTFAPTLADATRAKSLTESAGLDIPNIGTYIELGDLNAVEQAMNFAEAVGSPAFRVGFGGFGGRYREQLDVARAFLADIEPLARDRGIKALVEIHHRTILPSASLASQLLSGFDPEAIGALFDPGNMVFEGFEDYRLGIELLGPFLAHVHIKNAAFRRPEGGGVWRGYWAPLDDGVVDFEAVFAGLNGIGYDGWLVVEDFSGTRSTREALRHNLAFIKEKLASAGV